MAQPLSSSRVALRWEIQHSSSLPSDYQFYIVSKVPACMYFRHLGTKGRNCYKIFKRQEQTLFGEVPLSKSPSVLAYAQRGRPVKHFWILLASLFFNPLVLTAANAQVNHYYVAPTGSDSNDGTQTHPWKTINHADAALKLGAGSGDSLVNCGASYGTWHGESNVAVCVHVSPGSYNTTQVVTRQNGTPTQRIIWISDLKWAALIRLSSGSSPSVWVTSGAYTDVVGFDISQTIPAAWTAGTNGLVLNTGFAKAVANRIHDLHGAFADGTCSGYGGGGILSPENGDSMHDNQALGNLLFNIGGFCHFIHPIYFNTSNGILENNIVYTSTDGIACGNGCNNTVVAHNTILNNGGSGTTCASGGTGNECIGSTTVAFGNCVPMNSGTSHVVFAVNNVCVNNGAAGGFCPFNNMSSALGGLIANNMVYNIQSANQKGSGPQTACIFTNGGPAVVIGNKLSNSVGVNDPVFVNYQPDGTGDYHLRSGSPAINAGITSCSGTNLSCIPNVDFDGNPRPARPSLGAYEFVSSQTAMPSAPTGLTAVVQ
jgi:hypothetical protein